MVVFVDGYLLCGLSNTCVSFSTVIFYLQLYGLWNNAADKDITYFALCLPCPFSPSRFPAIYIHSFTSLGIKLGVVKEGKSRGRKGVEKWMCERGRKGTEEWQESGPVSTWNESTGLKILCQLQLRYSSQAKPEVLISVTGGGASGRN